MGPQHSPQARDDGLRKVALIKRWLIAGSVALTGVFTAVAAHALPGKGAGSSAVQSASSARSGEVPTSVNENSESSPGSLSAPAQAPQSGETQEPSSGEGSEGAQQPTEAAVVSGGS